MFDNLIKNWTSQSNEVLVSWKFTYMLYVGGVLSLLLHITSINTKLKRVQLSLFYIYLVLTDFSFWNQSPSLIIQVSVKTLYFSYSTRRKESFSTAQLRNLTFVSALFLDKFPSLIMMSYRDPSLVVKLNYFSFYFYWIISISNNMKT